LKRLDDDSYRKLQNLAQLDPDCAAVINWLRANKHRFRMEIVEPAAISLTVPNKGYVHAVEACFNITQLKVRPFLPVFEENNRSSDLPQTFVAQCDDDYRLLNRLVSDTTEALGKKARITTWFRPEETNITPPPMTAEEVRVLSSVPQILVNVPPCRCVSSVSTDTQSISSTVHMRCADF
jgi:structural maintenance of chromosomes protein 5